MKTITLEYPVRTLKDAPYRVIKVTDSTEFSPGEVLTKGRVTRLCVEPNWKVTVVPVSHKR